VAVKGEHRHEPSPPAISSSGGGRFRHAGRGSPCLGEKLNFDFMHDILPVAGIAQAPAVLAINSSLPAGTVAEFIAYAKARHTFVLPKSAPALQPPRSWACIGIIAFSRLGSFCQIAPAASSAAHRRERQRTAGSQDPPLACAHFAMTRLRQA
jgi:hypothetical protein